MEFKYLLFDLDGTLTDPKEGITKCVAYALKSYGVEVDNPDSLVKFIGPPLRESFSRFFGFSEEEAEGLVAKYRERYKDVGIFENRLFPGTVKMLRILKAEGKTIALATSKPEVFAVRILEKYGILEYFDEAVGSELDGRRDSKEEVIAEAVKRLDINAADMPYCVMIGDRHHDINGGKAFGLKTVGVRLGYAEPGELESAGADYIVGDMQELLDLLRK